MSINPRNALRAAPGLRLFFMLVVVSLASPVWAGWLPDGLPVCIAPGNQGSLVSAPDGLGGMLCVWQDSRSSQLKIYAQRVDANGNLLWTTNGVLVGFNPSYHPWICPDGAGGAYITFNTTTDVYYGSIFVQHLNASGGLMWGSLGVEIVAGNSFMDNSLPVCAADGLGGVIVAWVQQYNPPALQYQVVAQRLTSAGALLWSSQGHLVGNDIGEAEELDIVTDEPSNGAILGWITSAGTGTVQRVDLSGTPRLGGTVGYNLGLVTAGSRVRVADRKRVTQGAYIMSRWRGGMFTQDFLRITAIDSVGYAFWTRDVYGGGYSSPEPGNDYRLVDNGLNGVWCAWDRVNETGGLGVYAQMLESDGTPAFGQPTQVSGGTTGNRWPDVAIQYPTWNLLVSWVDVSSGTPRLKYTYVEPSIGYARPEVLVPGGYSSQRPCIVAKYASGSKPIISWMDQRVPAGQIHIYATGLETNGDPTHPNLVAAAINPATEPGVVGSGLNSFLVKVRNTGTCASDSFWTTIYPNQASPPSIGDPVPPGVQPVHCAPVNAGDSILAEVKITAPLTAQTWSMWGFADYLGQVDEFGQESDNIFGPRSYQWIALPNLSIAQVAVSNSAPYPGQYITATVKVKNNGYAAAASFYIDYYMNRASAPAPGTTGDQRHLVAGLAAGDSVSWTIDPVTSDVFAQWAGYFRVDTENNVQEMNENDNLAGPYYINWRIPPESGWPVTSGGGFHSSPVIGQLDDNPMTNEVVIGSDDGKLYAWGADGKAVAGWPVTLPDSILSSPALGDITGDFHNEVVVGCKNGKLYAYDRHGVKLWEYTAGSPVNTTPALADLDGDGKLEIVFSAGGNLYALEGNGSLYPGSWPYSAGANGIFTSPAIGNVDGTGGLEIAVIAHGYTKPVASKVFLLRPTGALYSGSWPVTVDTVIVADPVLGNVASPNTDLEIVAGGINGKVYLWKPTGAAWTPPRVTGMIETSAALANMDRDDLLEIVVSSRVYVGTFPAHWVSVVTAIDNDGSIISSWPKGAGTWTGGGVPMPSAVIVGNGAGNVIEGSPAHNLYAWDARGNAMYGFPISAGAAILTSAAVGDLDGDGWCELVVAAANDSVRCFKLCSDSYPVDDLWWPMFRHDRARTGCYGFVVPTGVDGPGTVTPAATCIRSVYPNPFNPTARIVFELRASSPVELAIYDVSGRRVAVLVSRELDAGRHEVYWNGMTVDGTAAASGVYFCTLKAGNLVETRKMVLLK
ncbi:MAG: CARDB domain-containing protein [Candidatus Krumholzibacteriaceae bacterium]|jgi:hypothetical protein